MCVSYLSSIILYTMTQQILNTSEAPENFRTLKTDDISKDEMKPGLLFANEEVALNAILKWGELTLCPIMKARRDKTLAESGGKSRGRRCLDCPHGRSRKGTSKGVDRCSKDVQKIRPHPHPTF